MNTRNVLASAATLFATSGLALAGGHALKADIEELDAEIQPAGTEWRVDARYEVEVETRALPPGMALVLQVQHGGQVLFNQDGSPFEVVVPLDRPTEADRDEFEFEGHIGFAIPTSQVTHHSALRIVGLVFPDPQSPALDRKDTDVDLVDGIRVAHSYVPANQPVVDQRYIEPAPQPVEQYIEEPVIVQQQQQQPVVVQQSLPAYAVPAAVPYVAPVYVERRPSVNFSLGFGRSWGFRDSCYRAPVRRTTVIRRSGPSFGRGLPVFGRSGPTIRRSIRSPFGSRSVIRSSKFRGPTIRRR